MSGGEELAGQSHSGPPAPRRGAGNCAPSHDGAADDRRRSRQRSAYFSPISSHAALYLDVQMSDSW